MTTTSNRREGFRLMPKRIAPETVAQIRALRARGYEVSEIVERVPASEMTVRRYLGMAVEFGRPRSNEAMNPLFDPQRDGVSEMPLTARLRGDPIPGRRELVAANRAREAGRRGAQ
jgi:hypothetical protein